MKASNVMVAALIALGASVWLFSGKGWIQRPEPQTRAPPPEALGRTKPPSAATSSGSTPPAPAGQANPLRVKVAISEAREYRPPVVIRGLTHPARQLSLRAEVGGRVVALPVAKGEAVGAGDLIAQLEVGERRSELAQADAALAQAHLTRKAAGALRERGFRAEANVAAAESALRQALATRDRIRRDIERTRIEAPFAGILETRPLEQGDVVLEGQVVGTLTDLDPILVRGRITAAARAELERGASAEVRIAGGVPLPGTLRFVASTADPITRTFAVEVAVANSDARFVAGLAAQARFTSRPRPAHLVPTAVLSVDADGRIGIKAVGGDSEVRFFPVEILGPDSRQRAQARAPRIWITGLPPRCQVIVAGGELLAPDQKVLPIELGSLRAYRPT